MKMKVSLDEVMSDDPSSPFWQHMKSSPDYGKFEQDIAYIMQQSSKHQKPFNDIDSGQLDAYDWKLK